MENTENKGEIILYKAEEGPELRVIVKDESVWLNQDQIAELFGTQRPAITKHLNNIFKSAEVSQNSVSSKRATQFRIWATKHLRDYILKGYLINDKRLKENEELKFKELQGAISLMQQALEVHRLEGYEKDLLKIITDYTNTWLTLYNFDSGTLVLEGAKKKEIKHLDHTEVKKAIERFRTRLMKEKEVSDLFGQEVSEKLLSLLGNLRQTFGGKDVYPTLDEKAAHLLYFAVKNHPFIDGNKRIGALLFILFLVQNN